MIGGLWQDFRFGVRSLGRTPTFTLSAVLTLGLGIGASTTIFGLFEAVVLRRLQLENASELYYVEHGADVERTGTNSNYPYFERVRALTDVFAGVTAYTRGELKVATAGSVEVVQGQYVSGNYHGVLGVPMLLGRGFSSEDDRSAAPWIAVISEGYWTRALGRDPQVLGHTLVIDGKPVSVVGVTAAGFHGLEPGTRLEITLPIAFHELAEPGFLTMHDTWTSMPVVARLRAGVTVEEALPALDGVFQQYVSEPENAWLREGGMAASFANAWLLPADGGESVLRDRYATALVVLMSMVGVLLLIACANVANLLLARGSARSKEVAVRLSIGAGRGRLMRQLLVESVQLALLSGALGLMLAKVGVDGISALLATGRYPTLVDAEPNATVLAFTIAVSALTGIVFGLLPAYGATKIDPASALKAVGAQLGRSRSLWSSRHLLVGGQIALCVLLVSGAGLLGRTLRGLDTQDGGFDRENVVMFDVDAEGTPFPAEQLPRFCDELIERMTVRLAVLSGSCSTSVPANTRGNARPLVVPATPERAPEESLVFMNRISPGYFTTLGVALLEGRGFDASDAAGSELVVVISRSAARFFFGDRSPIGRRVHYYMDDARPMTVVGVVEDALQRSLREDPPRAVYTPLTQLAEPETRLTVSLRATANVAELARSVRSEVGELDSSLVVDYIRTMDEQIAEVLVRERVLAMLSSAFGVLALLLSCVGLYGVVTYDVVRRARDLAIRLALGGQRADVLGQVLGRAGGVALLGVGVGLVATMGATRLFSQATLSALLFEVEPTDPLTLGAAVLLIVATTLLASYLPARRASSIDPLTVLRSE